MKKLIINADDFGVSEAVNRGICAAFQYGAITSATLLANFPAFASAVRIAIENPRLAIGAHLNLIRGEPLSPPEKVAPLLNARGRFVGDFWEIGKRCRDPQFLRAAEVEYRAQIEKILAAKITIDHLDFEKHHAVWRPLYALGARLADEYKIAIRAYHEPPIFVFRYLPWAGFGAAFRAWQLYGYQKFAHRKCRRAPCPDHFFGQTHIGAITEKTLSSLIKNLPGGVSELMCHPGTRDLAEEQKIAEISGESWITPRREFELAALLARDWQIFAAEHGVELTTFARAFF